MPVNCGSHRPRVVVVQVADPHAGKIDSMDGPTQLLQANATWIQAMKQEPNGDWTRKNGQRPLFENITACEKFLEKHCPVPAGQPRVIRCYCK